MGRNLLYIIFIAALLAGCKKNAPQVAPVTSPKMNGTFMWIGSAGASGSYPTPDAFVELTVSVIDDSSIAISNSLLKFLYIDSITHNYFFYYNRAPTSTRINSDRLEYNPSNNSMTYSSQANGSYGGAYMTVHSALYKPNSSIKDYLPGIIGTKTLSGHGYDTFIMREPDDSLYDIHVDMTFNAINDSTISFDTDLLDLGDSILHFKSTDYNTKKITFQTFHSYDFKISTLTYNYATHKLLFEQQSRAVGWKKYVRLE